VRANGTVLETRDSSGAPLRLLRPPVRLAETPATVRRPPPRLGEHTDEVLGELGLDAGAIASLRADGAIR
jgi:crotonobetainyl-CoA:carnitine CoA-transferase CaiB-like acyl-CoA transferase